MYELNSPLIFKISVADPRWKTGFFSVKSIVSQTLRRVHTQCIPWLWTEVSVVLTNDQEMQFLNKTYRHKEAPTNILSFGSLLHPLKSPHDLLLFQKSPYPNAPFLLGDLVLSYETIKKEADIQHKVFQNHFRHLLVHGMLHLLGYNHEHEEEAKVMEGLEAEILLKMGVKNPYNHFLDKVLSS